MKKLTIAFTIILLALTTTTVFAANSRDKILNPNRIASTYEVHHQINHNLYNHSNQCMRNCTNQNSKTLTKHHSWSHHNSNNLTNSYRNHCWW